MRIPIKERDGQPIEVLVMVNDRSLVQDGQVVKQNEYRLVSKEVEPVRRHELQMRSSGSFIRWLKRETDLPPKFRTPIEAPMKLSKEQQELAQINAEIETILAESLRRGDQKAEGTIIDVVQGVPAYLAQFPENSRFRRILGLLKAPPRGDFIGQELLGDDEIAPEKFRKTLVFAHHWEVIDALEEETGPDLPGGVPRYNGSVGSDKKRQKIIDQFQEDPSKRVIIIISLSGATGTTLTAAARMRVVEMDWLPANMIQIEDRIWRIGQLQNVDIGYLFIPESMDVKLGNLIIERMVSEEASLNTIKKIEKPGKTTKAGGLLSDDTLGAKPKAPPNKTETKTATTARQPARQDTEAQAQPDLFQI